jgi:hypothetical protein
MDMIKRKSYSRRMNESRMMKYNESGPITTV